jgi:hypothetical protein
MLKSKMEQVEGFKFDLQFFGDEGPGVGSGTPPAMNDGSQNVGATPTGQAGTPPSGTGQPANGQPQTVDWETHQAAIRGMNDAQRVKAAWEKTAAEYGFNSVEEAKRAFEVYKAVNDPNQAGALVKNYLTQNPDVLTALLRENPMQAAQIMGQVFNGQQTQADPFENVSTWGEAFEVFKQMLLPEIDKKYGSAIQPIQQTLQAQENEKIKSGVDSKIQGFIEKNPDSGVTQEAVWNKIKEIGIPMQTLKMQPWLIQGLIMETMGGEDKYAEYIAKKASSATAQNLTQKVLDNNSVAPLTPGGGVSVRVAEDPISNPRLNRQAVMEEARRLKALGQF